MRKHVWEPADYDNQLIRSMRNITDYMEIAKRPLKEGEILPDPPTPQDLARVFDWIINAAGQHGDNGFVPDDPNGRIGAFIDGRRSVASQVIKLMIKKPMETGNG